MYVQYGCGFHAPESWENFDASLTLRWERTPVIGHWYTKNQKRFPSNVKIGDIVSGLPVPEGSCQGVYASHVLEHLALADFHKALDNTRKVLKEGGIFRLVVPDLQWAAAEYLRRLNMVDYSANEFLMDATSLGLRKRRRGVGKVYSMWQTSAHLWMWDAASLAHALADHNFHDIRVCQFGDCDDPMFTKVEDPGRFQCAVAMECRR